MKYLLFCYDTYYPCGGMNDLVGEFDTIEMARDEADKEGASHYQIVNSSDWCVVERNN